jgi:hypothetical protein
VEDRLACRWLADHDAGPHAGWGTLPAIAVTDWKRLACPGRGFLSWCCRAGPGRGSDTMAGRRGPLARGTAASVLGLAVDRAGAVLQGRPLPSPPTIGCPRLSPLRRYAPRRGEPDSRDLARSTMQLAALTPSSAGAVETGRERNGLFLRPACNTALEGSSCAPDDHWPTAKRGFNPGVSRVRAG